MGQNTSLGQERVLALLGINFKLQSLQNIHFKGWG
uniref:Uncharacterized protein n=1 Tax=Anguilla anguilla TaxID=7936 RepID=A0A0E9SSK8_ANGAN